LARHERDLASDELALRSDGRDLASDALSSGSDGRDLASDELSSRSDGRDLANDDLHAEDAEPPTSVCKGEQRLACHHVGR
jgi:hypothetical protein